MNEGWTAPTEMTESEYHHAAKLVEALTQHVADLMTDAGQIEHKTALHQLMAKAAQIPTQDKVSVPQED